MTGRASITSIISKVLNVAGLDADSKGFGVDMLNKSSYSWVLTRFAIDIRYRPKPFNVIEIATWISDCNRLMSTRNFIVRDSSGEIICEAISQWCVIDLESRKSVDLSFLQSCYRDYILGNLDATIARPAKIASLKAPRSSDHYALYSDIDFNKHVNALRYLNMMLDMVDIELLEDLRPLRVDLHYQHESYIGDKLTTSYEQSGNVSLFEVVRNDEVAAVKCKIEWR